MVVLCIFTGKFLRKEFWDENPGWTCEIQILGGGGGREDEGVVGHRLMTSLSWRGLLWFPIHFLSCLHPGDKVVALVPAVVLIRVVQ